MDISINTDILISNNLSINEYIYLKNLYLDESEKIKNLYKIISNINEDSLQERGFIKITEETIVLRNKSLVLFEKQELFYKFLTVFPIKTPSGRYLSPAGTEGIAVTKLKKKWDTLFKNKEYLQEKAIRVLEAELKWRKDSNKLEYINAIETWLNSANYEKYEYLLDLDKNEINEKWM